MEDTDPPGLIPKQIIAAEATAAGVGPPEPREVRITLVEPPAREPEGGAE